MKIFGSLHFVPSAKESARVTAYYGAYVLVREFYKNLVKHGSFDEYHFFAFDDLAAHRKELSPYRGDARLRFLRRIDIPSYFRNTEYTIFFSPDPGLSEAANLRSQYSGKCFPICGLTHSISYAFFLHDVFFKNMLSDLRSFDSIACTSRAAVDAMRNLNALVSRSLMNEKSISLAYPGRLDHLAAGIDARDFAGATRGGARARLKLPGNKVILLQFGRFSISDKADLRPLFLVFKRLLARYPNILLVLAGKDFHGGYGGKVKQMAREMEIAKSVRFFFGPSHAEKVLLYSAADIFVSASDNLQETFGLAVLEAMAAGLPTVVTDWDGYKDLVVQGDTGFKIPTQWMKCDGPISHLTPLFMGNFHVDQFSLAQSVSFDAGAMTERLSALIADKDLRLKLGDAGRKRALREYDWSVVIPRFEKLWCELSEMARKDGETPREKPLFIPEYFECFRGYPTSILGDDSRAAITEEGLRALKDKDVPAGDPIGILSPEAILLILAYLSEKGFASIGEIRGHVQTLLKDARDENIRYNVMWMLKQAILRTIDFTRDE